MIKEFQGANRWLSNFTLCVVELDGVVYPSTENAYQAAKTVSIEERKPFETSTPGQAKRLGRSVSLRDDWESEKLIVMEYLNRQKFSKAPFKSMLLATGMREIQEGNTWGDTFWGVCNGRGENNLGKLIMRIREELQKPNQPKGKRT